jgi:RNA-directed DNA polymerase
MNVKNTLEPESETWNSLPWHRLEQHVLSLQQHISNASQRGDKLAVHSLQLRLIESEAARLLSVRRVTEENHGKDTPGVDGIKSLTPPERLAMSSTIHPSNWHRQPARPVRRVWIPKPGTTERHPLAVPSMIDRCKQALVKLALEPEWEARFEPHSYGFRPGRGAHEAITAIVQALAQRPAFIFDADIEGAFDHVNQTVLLNKLQTFPTLRRAINGWLTAGVMEGNIYFPSETGIPQGGVLSPLLMNVALHGMEKLVIEGSTNDYALENPMLVRYADDFLILHPELETLQQAAERVTHWLERRGLQLNAHKTRITHTLTPYQGQVGVEFLGFALRQELMSSSEQDKAPEYKTVIAPGEEASQHHLAAIGQRLSQLRSASQARVIEELNPLIEGWAAYYQGIVPAETLGKYDEFVERLLLRWARGQHPTETNDWLLTHYWHDMEGRGRVFATAEGEMLRLHRHPDRPKEDQQKEPATPADGPPPAEVRTTLAGSSVFADLGNPAEKQEESFLDKAHQ